MKLTEAAWLRRSENYRHQVGERRRLRRRHPITGGTVVEPVEIVDRLLPRDCEHDPLAIGRAGVFTGKYLARCEDCGIGGPPVTAASRHEATPAAAAAFFAVHPRASLRPVIDDAGLLLGWVETFGGIRGLSDWLAFSCVGSDAPGSCCGVAETPDAAAALVMARWKRTPTGAVRHG